MPVTERRKLTYAKDGTVHARIPKGWATTFGNPTVADLVIDTPVVFFPPSVRTNAERAECLQKIINILQNVPEPPYPQVKQGRKKK